MRFESITTSYYSDYNVDTFFNIMNLQQRITKMSVNVDLLDVAVFWFTNIERRKYNLKQFRFHGILRKTAFLHSEQMNIHNFFSHDNPFNTQYRTLTDRINSVKGSNFHGFMALGENIADYPIIKANEIFTIENRNGVQRLFSTNGQEIFPYTYYDYAKNVVEGWMNSTGHRANILNPEYEYLGCGCEKYEKQGNEHTMLYFKLTQNFGGQLINNDFLFGVEKTFNDIGNGIKKMVDKFTNREEIYDAIANINNGNCNKEVALNSQTGELVVINKNSYTTARLTTITDVAKRGWAVSIEQNNVYFDPTTGELTPIKQYHCGQDMPVKFADKQTNESACLEEVKRVSYDEHIRDFAIASKYESVCLEAVKRISCDEYIRDVAIAFKYESVCIEAIRRISYDEYIRDVAMGSNHKSVCFEAIKRISYDEYINVVKQKLNSLKY